MIRTDCGCLRDTPAATSTGTDSCLLRFSKEPDILRLVKCLYSVFLDGKNFALKEKS